MATYTIKYGDTLGAIAAANKTDVGTLAKLNNIANPDKIQAGASINLPDATPTPTPAPTPAPGSTPASTGTPDAMKAAFTPSNPAPYTTPTPNPGAITTSDLARGTTLPDASTYVATTPNPSLSDMVTKVAGTTLDSTGKAIDSLQAQREADAAAQKAAAEANVTTDTNAIKQLGQNESTAAQDALAAARSKFNVDQTISDLNAVQTKIAAAQEALQMGLIYETDRPAREQLILGRTASLQKQGLATIGALQATAQILQGNLDLAKSYAQSTIDAITTDNKNAMDALTTLLSLHNDKLVQLTADEKSIVDSRIGALQDQEKQLQSNQNDVFDLMSKYPSAAIAGGVTLLDDRATAIKKMLPKLSQMEQQKLTSDATNSKDGPTADKQQLLSLKANGMTYEEAVNAFSDTLSIDWIDSVYGKNGKSLSPADQITNDYYSQFLNPDGTVKSGYSVSFDPAHPSVPQVKQTGSSGATWWNPLSWF